MSSRCSSNTLCTGEWPLHPHCTGIHGTEARLVLRCQPKLGGHRGEHADSSTFWVYCTLILAPTNSLRALCDVLQEPTVHAFVEHLMADPQNLNAEKWRSNSLPMDMVAVRASGSCAPSVLCCFYYGAHISVWVYLWQCVVRRVFLILLSLQSAPTSQQLLPPILSVPWWRPLPH